MTSEVDSKCRVAELERVAQGFDQKYDLLVAEKMFVEEVRSSLKAQIDFLTQ